MAVYTITIGGVPHTIQPGFTIAETANGINTLSAEVLSLDGTYRPAMGDEVILTEDGVRIFGGTIDSPGERGFGDVGGTAIVTRISVVDFNELVSRAVINLILPPGTLKDALLALVGYIDGATLDPLQAVGPTLPELVFYFLPLKDALDQIATIAEVVYEVDYSKVLRAFEPSGTPAPFDVTVGNQYALGDVTVEPSATDYANRILILGGTGTQEVTDSFTGDGVTTAFPLRYTLASHRGYVTVGGVTETLGDTGTTWTYSTVGGTTTITRASAPGAAVAIVITYTAQFPVLRYAQDLTAIGLRGMHNRIFTAPEVFDVVVLQALADAYLARHLVEPRVVRYLTRQVGVHPGMTQTLTFPARGLSGLFLVTDVQIAHGQGQWVTRSVTAIEGTLYLGSWRDDLKQWGGSGSSAAISGSVTVVAGGGVSGTGTPGVLAKWTGVDRLGDGPIATSVLLSSGSYADPTWITSLAATKLTGSIANARVPASNVTQHQAALSIAGSQLTGTIATVVQDLITRLGTVVSGIWNAGAVTTTVLAVSGSVGSSLIPTSSDVYDLGRFDRLWNQGYLSQLNAIVFNMSTSTLFGGFSTIGKNAGTFAAAVSSGATTIDFGQVLIVGNWVLVRAHDTSGALSYEYLTIGSRIGVTTTYNVTRDLSASWSPDPAWASGTPYLVLGTTGDGRIDMYAYDGKPRIVFTLQGSLFWNQTDRAVIGNLNTYYGYTSDVYGAAFGDETLSNLTIDATNGLRIRQGTTTFAQMASSIFRLGLVSGNRVEWDGTNLTIVSATVIVNSTGIMLTKSSSSSLLPAHAYRFEAPTTVPGATYGLFANTSSSPTGRGLWLQNNATTSGHQASVGLSCMGGTSGIQEASFYLNTTPTTLPRADLSAKFFSILGVSGGIIDVKLNGGLHIGDNSGSAPDNCLSLVGWVLERGRSTPLGEWIAVTYAAGTYTASAGTWTVDAGDVTAFAYTLVGKTITVAFGVQTATISTGGLYLKIAIPGGFVAARIAESMYRAYNLGVGYAGYMRVTAGGTVIELYRDSSTNNWGAETNAMYCSGTITFEVQ